MRRERTGEEGVASALLCESRLSGRPQLSENKGGLSVVQHVLSFSSVLQPLCGANGDTEPSLQVSVWIAKMEPVLWYLAQYGTTLRNALFLCDS